MYVKNLILSILVYLIKCIHLQLMIKKTNLQTYIENVFLIEEKSYEEEDNNNKDTTIEDKKPFVMRVRATYHSKNNQEIVLLFFRLKDSKKVSVIYSTHTHIFACTLRRHWFNRTYIEQFFKLLKHVLKIQEARTNTKIDFEIKLFRFMFIALEVQKLIQFIRSQIPSYRHKGFLFLQRQLSSNQELFDLLQEKIS